MAQFDLYIDTSSGELVGGLNNPSPAPLPRLVQGDTISLRIYLLARTNSYPYASPFSYVSNANLSLKVALGPKTGTPGSALYTQQFTWQKDTNNQYFLADLPLNTEAIATLLGANATANAWLEVEYTQGGYPTTVFQREVSIHAEVIETGSLAVPAGATAMTAEEANAIFLKRENTGFFLTNPNTGKKMFVYLGDDDTLQASIVS